MNRAERRRAEREQAKLDRTLSKRKAEADGLAPGLLAQLREMRVGAVERDWPSVVEKLDEAIAAVERGAGKRAQVLVYEAAAEVARLRDAGSDG